MVLVSDHNWPSRDAIDGLSHGAFRLEVSARSFSAANDTDGWITEERVPRLMPRFLRRYVDELLDAGLWIHHPGKGYQLAGYFPWNKTSAQRRAISEANRKNASRPRPTRHGQGREPP